MAAFSGKHWVVTGAGSGMGLASARLLQSLGAEVALWDVNPAVKDCAADVCGLGVIADVTVPQSVDAAFAETVDVFGKIDGVLHAAGIMKTGLIEDLDPCIQAKMVQINLGGSTIMAHYAIPYLKQTRGSLVLFGSVAAFYGTPEFAAYAASKAGVLSFAQALRIEVEDAGVHVGVFCPHFVKTPLLNGNEDARFINQKSIFVTTHQPEDMAKAIIHGIAARRFLIVPSWRERLIYAMSRYMEFTGHAIMKQNWKS